MKMTAVVVPGRRLTRPSLKHKLIPKAAGRLMGYWVLSGSNVGSEKSDRTPSLPSKRRRRTRPSTTIRLEEFMDEVAGVVSSSHITKLSSQTLLQSTYAEVLRLCIATAITCTDESPF